MGRGKPDVTRDSRRAFGVAWCCRGGIVGRFALVTQTAAPVIGSVQLSALARELGIPDYTRRLLVEQELVTPLYPVRRGTATCIGAADADLVRQAWAAASETDIPVNVVLKVLHALEAARTASAA